MTRFLKPLAVAALVALGSAAQAAVVIDTFATPQTGALAAIDTTTDATGVLTTTAGAGILGGSRDLFVKKMGLSGTDDSDGDLSLRVTNNGQLRFASPDADVFGYGIVRWDGANSPAVDASNFESSINAAAGFGIATGTGFAGIDIFTGNAGFNLVVSTADAGFPFTLQVYSDTDQWSSVTLQSSGAGNYFIPFAAFLFPTPATTFGAGGAVNLNSVTALQATINTGGAQIAGVALDLTLTSAAAVPEPGTLALAGLLLTGLAVARRRQNKA